MSKESDQQTLKVVQGGQQQAHTKHDQVSFYDESLKKQVEGSFV